MFVVVYSSEPVVFRRLGDGGREGKEKPAKLDIYVSDRPLWAAAV